MYTNIEINVIIYFVLFYVRLDLRLVQGFTESLC